ncbi:MAG: spore coat protein U domain-containing protein [Burkholderiaceae bacterium]|nr:spore coat protein U domain-containing protein [Burkholderiaceae bacterium]
MNFPAHPSIVRACGLLCGSALMLAAAGPAQAGCAGVGVFACSATVSVPLPLSFGSYNPGSPKPGATNISVTGTVTGVGVLVTLSYAISLSAGTGGSITNRALAGPGTPLSYNLYTADTYQAIWGNNGRSDSYSLVASVGGVSQTMNYTVYGLIPAGQYVAAGNYTDTITVSVVY